MPPRLAPAAHAASVVVVPRGLTLIRPELSAAAVSPAGSTAHTAFATAVELVVVVHVVPAVELVVEVIPASTPVQPPSPTARLAAPPSPTSPPPRPPPSSGRHSATGPPPSMVGGELQPRQPRTIKPPPRPPAPAGGNLAAARLPAAHPNPAGIEEERCVSEGERRRHEPANRSEGER
ncbi:unnamed protein product [Urochloa humidicola]